MLLPILTAVNSFCLTLLMLKLNACLKISDNFTKLHTTTELITVLCSIHIDNTLKLAHIKILRVHSPFYTS